MGISLFRRAGIITLLCATVLTVQAGPAAAHLPAITVGCGDVPGLRAAIVAANDSSAHPGDDTISLASSCTYSVAEEYSTGQAFPMITSTIRLLGNGSTIVRSSTDAFRLFHVTPTGFLLMDHLTLRNGWGPAVAPFYGGAVFVDGDLFATDSTFDQNDNAVGISAIGGASFVRSSFTGNDDAFNKRGGAVSNFGLAYFESSTLTNNGFSSSVLGSHGGALYNNNGEMTLYKSTITDSFARIGGAIANLGDDGRLLILNSTLHANEAVDGGALWAGGGFVTISNSTIARNSASNTAGALLTDGGASVMIEHSTIASNFQGSVGGIVNRNDEATIDVSNSILGNGTEGNCSGTILDGGYTIAWPRAGCPSTFIEENPALDSLASYGGPTLTMRLGGASAARDRIPSTGAGCLSKDQRDQSRPAGGACDIGAFESQPPGNPGAPTSVSPNKGVFTLSWTAATDPDNDPVQYALESKDTDDADWISSGITTSANKVFLASAPEREGRLLYRVRASDGMLSSPGFGESGVIVVDRTAPAPPTPSPQRSPEYVDPATSQRWFADTITVGFTPGSDPALADTSAGTGIAVTTSPQTFNTPGAHVASGTSTDAAGNESSAGTYALNVDTSVPVVTFASCPESVLLNATQSAGWTASDTGSGVAGQNAGSVPLTSSSIGEHTVYSPAVLDSVGHSATGSCTYDVIWDFKGFAAPLRAFPSIASVGAGQQIRVNFSLGGNQGLGVLAPGYPVSAPISCSSSAELTSGDPTTANGPLTYSTKVATYTYPWTTSPSWRNTCRQLIVKLQDGTFHRANVKFR